MNTRTATATTRIAALAVGLLSLTAATATAAQDAGPMMRAADTSTSCPLTRVGTEYVRCDDLTGNGVAAPAWVAASSAGVTDLGAVALASVSTASATGTAGASSGQAALQWRRLGI